MTKIRLNLTRKEVYIAGEKLTLDNSIISAEVSQIRNAPGKALEIRYRNQKGQEEDSPVYEDGENIYLLIDRKNLGDKLSVDVNFVQIEEEENTFTPYVAVTGDKLEALVEN